MALIGFDRDFRRLQREMDKMFGNWEVLTAGDRASSSVSTWAPRVDVVENDKELRIHAELPGMNKENVHINYDEKNRMLSIEGESKVEKKEENDKYHVMERSYGKFHRAFSLPAECDIEAIAANFNNGVLDINVPKLEKKSTTRKINIL